METAPAPVLQGEGPEAATPIQKRGQGCTSIPLTYEGLVAARVWSAAARAVA